MALEDQIQRCSYSNGGGSINSRSSSKKPKQRKTPQRGLGVAQLEKIRIEEQLKKDVAAITSASILSSPSSMSSSSYPTLPDLSHPHSNQSLSSSSFLSASQANLSLSNSIMRPPFPTRNVDSKNSISLSLVNQASHCGFEAMWAGMSMLRSDDTFKMLKSCEYNVERGNYGADPGLSCRSNTFNPYQSNFGCLPMQITQQYQPSSVSVDISSTSSTSSLLNFQMEPPSNQIYYCNYPTTVWPEEEKIGGMKRPYPFSLDDPPGISSNHRSRTSVRMRSDESLCENGGSNPSSKLRDSRLNSTYAMAQNRKKCFIDNNLTQDFLALTPSAHPGFQYNELHDFELLPFQKDSEEVSAIGLERIGLSRRLQFHSFFPQADATHISHGTKERNGETGDSVDLSLKL